MTATPVLLARLAEGARLRGTLVSIDVLATNGTIAAAIRQAGAAYLLAVKVNHPRLRADIDACFNDAPVGALDQGAEPDNDHGRIELREIEVITEVDWQSGKRRLLPKLRLPDATYMRARAYRWHQRAESERAAAPR